MGRGSEEAEVEEGGRIGGGKGNRQRGKNGASEPRKEKENERREGRRARK